MDDESSEEDDDNGKGWINPTNVTKYLNCSTEPVKE